MKMITGYLYVEKQLADFLESVPYDTPDPAGKTQMPPGTVWSPRLALILQETCSQLDSYLRHELVQKKVVPQKGKYHNIGDFKVHFSHWLSPRKVFFWQDDNGMPVPIAPYEVWPTNGPNWWQAYNAVKHDRLKNRKQATLQNCIEAMAALLLALAYLSSQEDLTRRQFLSSGLWKSTIWLGELDEVDDNSTWRNLDKYAVVETPLFTYVLGWWNRALVQKWLMQPASRGAEMRNWGGFHQRNHPEQVVGSTRWKSHFNAWLTSVPIMVNETTQYKPLI